VTDTELDELRLLNVSQLRNLLPISRSSMYRLLASGELVSVRVGHNYLIRVSDLVTFLEAHKSSNN
jgi:excisionase family DNA binding protein